jgi:hypothetical protein
MKEVSTKDPDHKSRCWTGLAHCIATLRPFGFLLLLLVTNPQCKKSSPPPNVLPPMTQEGKNTFGCKVNGEVWTPYFECTVLTGSCKELGFGVYHNASMTKLPVYFTLSVRRVTRDTLFTSFDMYTDGEQINNTGNVIDSVFVIYTKGTTQFSNLLPNHKSGTFNVTKLDTVGNILSGTFSFTLHDISGDSVIVTDGRFDMTYNACLCH